MPNPIFQLLNSSLTNFNNTHFTTVEKKQKTTDEKFYVVIPKTKGAHTIKINGKDYKLSEGDTRPHITVFEDRKADEGGGRAAYHLTMQVASLEEKSTFSIRSYFGVTGNLLYTNCKDEMNVLVALPINDGASDVVMQLIAPFNNAIQTIHHLKDTHASREQERLVALLTEKSTVFDNKMSPDYSSKMQEYFGILNSVIVHMEEWHNYKFNPDIKLLGHFCRLRTLVEKEILTDKERSKAKADRGSATIDSKETNNEEAKAGTVFGEAAPHEVKALAVTPIRSKAERIIQRHKRITKEIEQLQASKDYFKKIITLKKLVKQAYQEFNRLLLESVSIPRATWTDLLDIIPTISHADFVLAVNNKNHLALELMLEHSRYALGNTSVLLEKAYCGKDIQSLELLLNAKVNYDYRDAMGQTLLMRACLEARKNEMVLFLRAGASQYAKANNGYSALGYLTMRKDFKPPLDLVEAFLINCVAPNIDLMQGTPGLAGTALTFACQEKWKEQVKLYLRYGADPCYVRATDRLSALAICAAKGYDGLLIILLEQSRHPLDSAYGEALMMAEQYGQKQCAALLLKKTEGKPVDTSIAFPIGTSTEDLYAILRDPVTKAPTPGGSAAVALGAFGAWGNRPLPAGAVSPAAPGSSGSSSSIVVDSTLSPSL